MTAGRWAKAPAGEQTVREGALGTMHGNSCILESNSVGVGCTLRAGQAVETRRNEDMTCGLHTVCLLKYPSIRAFLKQGSLLT